MMEYMEQGKHNYNKILNIFIPLTVIPHKRIILL
jgi:hypothetical protein